MDGISNNGGGMPLSELLGTHRWGEMAVAGLQLDSRCLAAGDAFIAMPGEHHDGRDFFAEASAANAGVILAEKGISKSQRAAAAGVPIIEIVGLAQQLGTIAATFYGRPSEQMYIAGITGTNGKTTTSRLLAQLLRNKFDQCGVIGTLGAVLDDEVNEAVNTTPDALSLQRKLAQWYQAGVRYAALEVSSHSLVQGRVSGVRFDTAVFSNLSHDHLDYHGSMGDYGLAKARLFELESISTAVINVDDPFSESLIQVLHPSVQLLSYSVHGTSAEIMARNVSFNEYGVLAELSSPWGEGILRSPLAADFNLANLLAALAVACSTGVELEQVLALAPHLQGVPGRMQYVPNNRGVQLVVDYAHTPDALQQALVSLRAHTRGQLICVFGCGGDRDKAKRPLMGRVATENADRVIVTSDNPRSESMSGIIADVLAGCEYGVEVEPDRAAAIRLAVATARQGDCVLVAGKGHENYQQLADERLSFSDVAHLRAAADGVHACDA